MDVCWAFFSEPLIHRHRDSHTGKVSGNHLLNPIPSFTWKEKGSDSCREEMTYPSAHRSSRTWKELAQALPSIRSVHYISRKKSQSWANCNWGFCLLRPPPKISPDSSPFSLLWSFHITPRAQILPVDHSGTLSTSALSEKPLYFSL